MWLGMGEHLDAFFKSRHAGECIVEAVPLLFAFDCRCSSFCMAFAVVRFVGLSSQEEMQSEGVRDIFGHRLEEALQ